jgi:hypothetical protein
MKDNPFYQAIMNEGRVEEGRAKTLVALEERFGAQAAAQVADVVNALEDRTELDRLFRLAMRCAGIEQFRQALQPARPRRTTPRRSPRARR